jgi:hypothetical protein
MTNTVDPHMPRAERRRTLLVAVGRGLGIATVLTVAYFSLPLKGLATLPLAVIVISGVILLAAVIAYQVIAIFRAAHPAIKAIEALSLTGPLFLLLFATTYFLMSQADSANFNLSGLTRSDSLYFTVTVFTTVGFGDILATSHSARALVTVQMILDLILIGAVIRAFVEAVRRARETPRTPSLDA